MGEATMQDWRTLPAGVALDVLVAERVFGFVWRDAGDGEWQLSDGRTMWEYARRYPDQGMSVGLLESYSSDIAAAWRVVDRLRADRPFTMHDIDGVGGTWMATFEVVAAGRAGRGRIYSGEGATAPLAICRAALAAMEVK